MTDPAGGFYSTQDADSEGEEGKYYVWTPDEIEAVLGPEAARLFNAYYGVTPEGNFEHKNVLHVTGDLADVAVRLGVEVESLRASLAESRAKLFAARQQRVPPGRDEKVLAAWNGLMLRALAEAAAALERDDYRTAAVRNAEFLTRELVRDGRVLRSWKAGRAKIDGYLEDYALLIDALIGVHELTFEPRWLETARQLADRMLDLFWDDTITGFYDTPRDGEPLVVRPRDVLDNATPAGNSVAVSVLLRLAVLLDRPDYAERAVAALSALRDVLARYPSAFGELLQALDFHLAAPLEVAVVGDPGDERTRTLLREVYRRFLPNKVVAGARPDDPRATVSPLLAGRGLVDGRPAAYVCRHYTCRAPVTAPEELAEELASAAAGNSP